MNRQEELLIGERTGGGRWYSWRSAIGEGEKNAVSLTPDVDGKILVLYWIQFCLPSWKKLHTYFWVVVLLSHHWWQGSTGLHYEWLLQFRNVPFYIWVRCLKKLQRLLRLRKSPHHFLCHKSVCFFSYFFLLSFFVFSPGHCFFSHHHCFHTCFWTSWAWNEDTVLLYSIQHWTVKYTQAPSLVEDARTWQCKPDMWTNLCNWTCQHRF